jgi:hypothetical protein
MTYQKLDWLLGETINTLGAAGIFGVAVIILVTFYIMFSGCVR